MGITVYVQRIESVMMTGDDSEFVHVITEDGQEVALAFKTPEAAKSVAEAINKAVAK